MTEGISKEYLEGKLLQAKKYNDVHLIDLLKYLISQCTELDPWMTIKDAPKDRMILIWDDNYGQCTANWNEFYLCHTDIHGHKYHTVTKYKLLPEDPK